MNQNNRWWYAGLLLALLWPLADATPAQAAARTGIYPFQSVETTLPQAELTALSRKVLFQFEQNDLYKIVRKYPLTGGKKPKKRNKVSDQRNKDLRISRRFLANAVKQMKASQFEKVIPLLKLGITKAAKTVRWKEGFEILSRMCALWSLAAFQMGRGDEGELLLKVLARMSPKPLPPEVKANRQLQFRYSRALKTVSSGAKGSIRVIGTEGSTVFIDGKKLGKVPKEAPSLPVGIHYVRVTRPGHMPYGKAIKVTAGGTVTVQAYLSALPKPKLSNMNKVRLELNSGLQLLSFSSRFKQMARTVCRHGNLRHLFSANLKKAGQEYLLTPFYYNCETGQTKTGKGIKLNSTFIDAELPIYRAMIPLVRDKAAVPTRRRVAIRPPVRGQTPGKKGGGIASQWWFWTLITVGVAGGAAAGVTYYLLTQPPRIGVSAKWNL